MAERARQGRRGDAQRAAAAAVPASSSSSSRSRFRTSPLQPPNPVPLHLAPPVPSTMPAPLRSLARLVARSRPCASASLLPSAPALRPAPAPAPPLARAAPCAAAALRHLVRSVAPFFPVTSPWGRPLQPHRGFLGIGDGDEDIGLSKHFEEDRVIGYTPEQVFDVVAGVDLYEDFVPWCLKSKVLWRTDHKMDAELEIGFKLFVERYISHVELKPPSLIKTTVSQSALFDFLNNEWHFKPGPTSDSCHLFFVVDFQFKSPLYRRVANMFFNEVQARLVGSFEERCQAVYGPSMETAMRSYTAAKKQLGGLDNA